MRHPSGEETVTSYVLAIDQGMASTRAILLDADTSIASLGELEFPRLFRPTGG